MADNGLQVITVISSWQLDVLILKQNIIDIWT